MSRIEEIEERLEGGELSLSDISLHSLRILLAKSCDAYEEMGLARDSVCQFQHPELGMSIQTLSDRRLCEQMNAQCAWINRLRDEIDARRSRRRK